MLCQAPYHQIIQAHYQHLYRTQVHIEIQVNHLATSPRDFHTSVDPYGDPSYVPSYVPSVNPSRAPSKKQVGDIQEERHKKLIYFKSLEDIIASVEIKVYESAQLQELYIIKLKRNIFMFETNVNNFLGGNRAHIYLKTETKRDYII